MAVELVERSGAAGTEVTAATSAAEMRARLQDMKQKISLVQAFFRDVMVQNEDYGVIPGTDKPTLLKPGAEKLCEFYGYSIHVATEREEKDRETGWYDCAVKVTLISRRTGEVIAEGVGEANTYESRYRYRWVWPEQVPADIDKSALVTRKTKSGKLQYRLENDDLFSLWNTVKKMAKKRALIDATLSATRSSGIFTQDVEDLREWAAQGEVIDAEYTMAGGEGQERPSRPQRERKEPVERHGTANGAAAAYADNGFSEALKAAVASSSQKEVAAAAGVGVSTLAKAMSGLDIPAEDRQKLEAFLAGASSESTTHGSDATAEQPPLV